MDLTLTDGVVTLSPMLDTDVEAHVAGEDEELRRWHTGGKSTVDGTRAYVARCTEQWAAGGPHLAFAIRAHADDGTPVLAGTTEFQYPEHLAVLEPGQANIAYGLYPAFRGRGIATRTVELLCGHASRDGRTRQAVIRVEDGNDASVAVALRAGFTFLRHETEPDGTGMRRHTRDLA